MNGLINKTRIACVLCAVALCFGVALAGCSSGSSSSAASSSASAASSSASASASASSEAASSASASASSNAAGEVVVPTELASAVDASKAVVRGEGAPDAAEFDALPKSDAEEAPTLASDEIEEGLEDASKAPGDATLLMTSGIQMLVPSDWFFTSDEDGFVFQNPEGSILGFIYGFPKQPGVKYDVESIVKSVPINQKQNGYTNIEIISYNVGYSAKGTLVSADVTYAASYEGQEYIFYSQVVESTNFINCVEIGGTTRSFGGNLDLISAMIDTVGFNEGEII